MVDITASAASPVLSITGASQPSAPEESRGNPRFLGLPQDENVTTVNRQVIRSGACLILVNWAPKSLSPLVIGDNLDNFPAVFHKLLGKKHLSTRYCNHWPHQKGPPLFPLSVPHG